MTGLFAAYLSFLRVGPAEFDAWAQARDSVAIEAHASPALAGKFSFLKGSGAFGVGRTGWHAFELDEPETGKKYIVFSSALTTQDIGEQVFEWDGASLVSLVHERDTRGVRIRKATLEIRFDVPQKLASIAARVECEKSASAGKAFFIRLGDNYTVASVFDEHGERVPFRQAGGIVSLPTPADSQFTYQLVYQGIVNRPRFAGAIVDDEVMLTNDYWWPHIARLPMKLTTTTHVPKGWTVVAQGEKFADRMGDERVVTFENNLPVSYMSLSAGKFGYREKKVGDITYFVASRELSVEQMDDQLEYLPPIIQFFSTLRKHPYSTYGAVDTRLYGGGALEAYSYATYGTGWLPAEDPHEPSHTWWGGILPNTYLDSFWNESFAVFSEGLYRREGAIGDKAAKRLAFVSPANSSPIYQQFAAWDTGSDNGNAANALGYGRGGVVLQQLELEMGTSKLMGVLRSWLANRPEGEPEGWPQFERACGPEWTWFFDQWIRGKGWPVLTVGSPMQSGSQVKVKISQKQPYYRLKLEYALSDASGWHPGTVDVLPDAGGECVVTLPAKGSVQMISFDPYDRVMQPRRPKAAERISEAERGRQVFDPKNILESRNRVDKLPQDLGNVMLVGTPAEVPQSAKFWAKTGVKFSAGKAQWNGVSIDLNHGAVLATVDLEGGKWVLLRAGKTKYYPETGISCLAMVDDYGRFLTGKTLPRTNGPLVVTTK